MRSIARGANACSASSARCSIDARLPALYVTHDHEEAFALADRIVVMRAGRVVQVGAGADVWRRPADEWTAAFLGFGPAVDGVTRTRRRRRRRGVCSPVDAPGADDTVPCAVVLRPDAVRLDPAGAVRGDGGAACVRG